MLERCCALEGLVNSLSFDADELDPALKLCDFLVGRGLFVSGLSHLVYPSIGGWRRTVQHAKIEGEQREFR